MESTYIYIIAMTTAVLTNLDELSFFTVLALPKASRMGFACSSCASNSPCEPQYNIKILVMPHT